MSISYTIKESLLGFKRNRTSTLITIFTVSISLLLLGVFTILTANFSKLVENVRKRVDVEVFLKERITEEQSRRTGELLRLHPGIEEATYISKEEAARIFEQELGNSFTDILEGNPLPASYRLKIREGYGTPDSIASIERHIKLIWTVDQVVYRKQFLTLIDKRARAFQYATLFIGIALAISAMILVANTIKLTIYAKRETIRTMRLVGATPMFIRMPFLFEGMFHGILGGFIASILIFTAFVLFIQPLSDDLLIHIQLNAWFFVFLVWMGAMLGLLGSILSVGHFLKETLSAE